MCLKLIQGLASHTSFEINNLYTGNPSVGTFANSEDPDEMQHNAAFHQCLFVKVKKDLLTKEYNIFLKIIT